MKKILNVKDSVCAVCGGNSVDIIPGGEPFCRVCGSHLLKDKQGGRFEPLYGPAKTFRASPYTPPLPDRREEYRLWPKAKERRKNRRLNV